MSSSSLSRRRFLAIAGGAAGAVALAPLLSSCEASPPAGPSAYSKPKWQESLAGIAAVNALVLVAAGGVRLQQEWGVGNKINLMSGDNILASFGTVGDVNTLNLASDATFAPDGTVWIVDRGNRRLLHLDQSLRPIATVSTINGMSLRSPAGVAALSDGRIVFTDTRLGVGVISPDSVGIRSTSWISSATTGVDGSVAVVPRQIAVGPGDEIVFYDRSNGTSRQLRRLNSDGSKIASVRPPHGIHTSIAIASNGDVIGVNASTQTLSRIGSDGSSDVIDINDVNSIIGRSLVLHDRQRQAISPGDATARRQAAVPVRITSDRITQQLIISTAETSHDFHIHVKGDSTTQLDTSKAGN
ncbi:MAG: hypothetical protein NT081_08320 [Actinobacteria bacterium]|nr:hypothetical protein [Actinomycetota bacterium]